MTVPNDLVRFQALLYLSLLIDALSAAFLGPSQEKAAERAATSLFGVVLIAALLTLVWLAAERRQNWARWTLLGFFTLVVVTYLQAFSGLSLTLATVIDLFSLAVSALGFYYGFTTEAQQWFRR